MRRPVQVGKKPHDYLKVNDVIKYARPVIDWEVEVTNVKDPSDHMIASNDMYPLFDADGKVSGVAEISRSRNTRIKQVRDTLGLTADYTFEDIMGDSKPMADAKNLSMSFAASPYNVLIYGESGVGKELFAQSIHNYSVRRNKPFVAINCASISPELIDSELFGYESGAFTGAAKTAMWESSNCQTAAPCFSTRLPSCPPRADKAAADAGNQSDYQDWRHQEHLGRCQSHRRHQSFP